MTTYAELQVQILELERQAERARQNEIESALAQIRSLMQTYGITVADLEPPKQKPRGASKPVAAKYRDPVSGQTWTGRGRAPLWLNGRSKDDFRIA